jgi:hypothetical protein
VAGLYTYPFFSFLYVTVGVGIDSPRIKEKGWQSCQSRKLTIPRSGIVAIKERDIKLAQYTKTRDRVSNKHVSIQQYVLPSSFHCSC